MSGCLSGGKKNYSGNSCSSERSGSALPMVLNMISCEYGKALMACPRTKQKVISLNHKGSFGICKRGPSAYGLKAEYMS